VPTLSYPGVYLREISSGVRPLEVAGTSTPAFVGVAEMGPDSLAQPINSWAEYQRYFGGFVTGGFLAQSVYAYFLNGGRRCYVLRVTRTGAKRASVTVRNRATPPVDGLVVSARSSGTWGNSLYVQIEDGSRDPGNEFRISVRRQSDPRVVVTGAEAPQPVEVFDDLSVDAAAPNYVNTVIARESALIDASVPKSNASQGHGRLVAGAPPVLPLGSRLSLQIDVDGDGVQRVTLPSTTGAALAAADVAAALQAAVRALQPTKTSTSAQAFSDFTVAIETVAGKEVLVLSSGTTAAGSVVRVQVGGTDDAATMLKVDASSGARSEGGLAVRRPVAAEAVQIGDSAVGGPVTAVTAGSEGTGTLDESSFSAAFARLEGVTDASLLAVPGENTPTLVSAGLAYCATRPLQDMFYLGELAQHDDVNSAVTFRNSLTVANSYGALYFPWVLAPDPSGRSATPLVLPPSGFVAGLYGRIDAVRGVWKAPAGAQAGLFGVSGLAVEVTDTQHGVLNPLGVAVIRRFPAAGVVAYGARTVSSDAEWRYIPVRRTAIMLRVSIYNGIQWAVFEPNDEPLWAQLRLNITSFMTTLFRQGAFAGSSAREAFFVKCDAETTTPDDVQRGVVNVLVGFAPLRPAEFVVVTISQLAGQASA
jgi:phage tail sheath protein FI